MQMTVREVRYHTFSPNSRCYLIGDIGGTNANFGIFRDDAYPPVLLLSLHVASKDITDFAETVAQLVDQLRVAYRITIVRACFGAAGVLDTHHIRAKPTNLDFIIDLADIKKKTGIESMVMINDFQAVGFGIQYMPPKSLVTILPGQPRNNASKAAIGAGTGLGKCIMAYHTEHSSRLILSSEGGHGDFAVQNEFDLAYADFIRTLLKMPDAAISWEDVLSGAGIIYLYKFLATRKTYPNSADTDKIEQANNPDVIFEYWQKDQRCIDTFHQYSVYYARASKNFALDALALGGLFIAGGIAAKNIPLFQLPEFKKEFLNCRKQHSLLESIPVTVVADYNVSLYGGAHFLLLFTGGLPNHRQKSLR